MPTLTRDEALIRLRAPERAASSRPTAGSRFVTRAVYRELLKARNEGIFRVADSEVLNSHQLGARLRSIDLTTLVEGPAPPSIQMFANPAPLLDYVTTIVSTSPLVSVVEQDTWTPTAGAVADGAPLAVASSASYHKRLLEAQRIVAEMPVGQELIDDVGQVEAKVDQLLETDWARKVQGEIISGDGSTYVLEGVGATSHLTGVLGVAAHSVSVGSYPLDSLAEGVRRIRRSGWLGPHVVACASTTLERIETLKDDVHGYHERENPLPSVIDWIPCEDLDDGVGLVMDPREIELTIVSGFGVTATNGYTDVAAGVNYFSAGLVRMLGEARVACWVRNPTAAAVVTGL